MQQSRLGTGWLETELISYPFISTAAITFTIPSSASQVETQKVQLSTSKDVNRVSAVSRLGTNVAEARLSEAGSEVAR